MLLPLGLPGPGREGFATRAGVPGHGGCCETPGGPGPGIAAGRDRVLLPGPAKIGGQGPGEQELGVRGDEEPGPAVGLLGDRTFAR